MPSLGILMARREIVRSAARLGLVGVVSVVAVVLVWVAYYHAYWGFRVLVGS